MNVLALVACLWTAACRDELKESSTDQPSYILPSMRQPGATNANATPPRVPFDATTPRVAPRVLGSWRHDTSAYTQGLLVYEGRLLEGTGLEGHSDLREVNKLTGLVLRRTALPATSFGEGIAVIGGRIFELTWREGRGFVYDVATLAPVDSFKYEGEGWGLTTDGTNLYMSDGSNRLRIIDPKGFTTIRTLPVSEAGQPVWMLNALEYVHGEVWANVYQTDLVARIDARTGHVIGWLDVSKLLTDAERADVSERGGLANGIAFDSAHNVLLVTGKLWPRLFALDLDGVSPLATNRPPSHRSTLAQRRSRRAR
ncbi:hypothetical protein BH11GEM1_BH11GEM1_16360 [soil metagenome]